MKLTCNKLRNENQHMFYNEIKKNLFPFSRHLFKTKSPYWKVDVKSYNLYFENLFLNDFYNLKYESQCTIM